MSTDNWYQRYFSSVSNGKVIALHQVIAGSTPPVPVTDIVEDFFLDCVNLCEQMQGQKLAFTSLFYLFSLQTLATVIHSNEEIGDM